MLHSHDELLYIYYFLYTIFLQITTKLAGSIDSSATWMTNVANEHGEVLNSVFTTSEGTGLQKLCQGIVKRYQDAAEPEPEMIFVDRDCCSMSGVPPVLTLFHPWRCHVRLDIWHWMQRFNCALTTEHPLYGTWCTRLSSCIFMWDPTDLAAYTMAKKNEYRDKHGCLSSENQVRSTFTIQEMARHCKRTTRGVEETHRLVEQLLNAMWDSQDTNGVYLINRDAMSTVWKSQQKHLHCIQDIPGVQLYTKTGTMKKGGKILNVYRCARGSVSLESFHKHQCNFIPGNIDSDII